MSRFEHITNKFYTSESERLLKIEQNKELIEEFTDQMKDVIKTLAVNGTRLWIFEARTDIVPPTLYAGLGHCCDENVNVDKDRKFVEDSIIANTRFKKIIWEL